MAHIVLLGGAYGSGKSTTAELAAQHPENPYKTAVIDYDMLIGNSSGKVVDVQNAEASRKKAWNELFIPAITGKIEEGNELVLVPGTFSTRERRERFIHTLEKVADVTPLYFMIPMRETVQRIRNARIDDTHLVNHTRYREFYSKFNQQFARDDHTDLLLPHDRDMLAPEYRALLSKQPHNKEVLQTPHLDWLRPHQRWIVVTQPLEVHELLGVVHRGLKHPHHIREFFGHGEGQIAEPAREMKRHLRGFYH